MANLSIPSNSPTAPLPSYAYLAPTTTNVSTPPTATQPGQTATKAAVASAAFTPSATLAAKIQGMFSEQSFKALGKTVRFTLSLPNVPTFVAHLDPSDISLKQQKRYASLDVLTGIVLQDFGYKAPILEVKGTTGSAYYTEIKILDAIFTSQNLTTPVAVSIGLENFTFTATWTDFTFSRMINATAGNLVSYQMAFVIFSKNGSTTNPDSLAAGSSVVAQQALNNTTNATITPTDITWTGSMMSYIQKQSLVRSQAIVLLWLQNNFNTAKYGAMPGPSINLGAKQLLTVPNDWKSITDLSYFNG